MESFGRSFEEMIALDNKTLCGPAIFGEEDYEKISLDAGFLARFVGSIFHTRPNGGSTGQRSTQSGV